MKIMKKQMKKNRAKKKKEEKKKLTPLFPLKNYTLFLQSKTKYRKTPIVHGQVRGCLQRAAAGRAEDARRERRDHGELLVFYFSFFYLFSFRFNFPILSLDFSLTCSTSPRDKKKKKNR